MGGVSAEVYGALLQVLEGKSRSVRDELAPEDYEDEEVSYQSRIFPKSPKVSTPPSI